MVAKLALVLVVLVIILAVVVIAAYRYFDNRAKERHEKQMLREERDADMLSREMDTIDRELERERQR